MMISVFDGGKIVGKEENVGYQHFFPLKKKQHFLLFPQCFQKACFMGGGGGGCRKKSGFCGKEVTKPFPFKTHVFTRLQYKSLVNTMEKEETADNVQSVLVPHCFLPFRRTESHFHKNSRFMFANSFT